MAEQHEIVTKVWIAPGCIVCDACENDCPEVFDVTETTCLIKPPAQSPDFLKNLTPSIQVAAEGCPVNVIKFETQKVDGPAPWPKEGAAPAAAGAPAAGGHAPAVAKAPAPMAAPDPKLQALLSTSKISPSKSGPGLAAVMKKSPEVAAGEDIIREVDLPKNASADQRMALLAVGGAYQPTETMASRLVTKASGAAKTTRRTFNLALVAGWGALAFVGATFGAMFQDFFGPKVLKEPKTVWRVGRLDDFTSNGTVYEQFKPQGIWMVNLQPKEGKLVALSTTCTHLGCIPNWLQGDQKFKCPCHGSGYYINGVNFEGPTPRPLERYKVMRDADGYIVVDKSKVYRSELGEWDNPESYVPLA